MLKNYVTIAFRSLLKQKGFAFINILGLAIGLASAVLIFLYIVDELRFDRVHKAPDRTYRIGANRVMDDGNEFTMTGVPGAWSAQLKEQYPDVEEATRYLWLGYPVSMAYKEADRIFLTEELLWVEPTFPNVFYFPVVQGNPEKVFELPNSIVLTQTAAKRFFEDADPIGKTLVLKHWVTDNQEVNVTVTGVIEDFPSNSHVQADYLVNFNLLGSVNPGFNDFMMQWNNGFFNSYIVLSEGADPGKITEGLSQLLAANLGEQVREFQPFFRKITDIHFDSEIAWVNEGAGDISYIYIFGSIALLILIIACINYMNMSTARSAKRSKEVGMRKSLGSCRSQLIGQFMSESLMMTLISLVLAFFIVLLALPYFNDVAQKSFTLASLANPWMLFTLTGIIVFVALVAGSYPALYLSGFHLVEVLKGHFTAGKRSEVLRKGLVVFQFCISIILIICTGIVMQQMNFLSTSKLNESGDQLISIRYGGNAPAERYQTYKNLVLQDADIEQVTMANHLPRQDYFGGISATFVFPDVSSQEYEWSQLHVDFDFSETFNLEFLAGRNFSEENLADSSACLLNEAAVSNLGITPEEAIGMAVMDNEQNEMCRIIGVVKDFPYRSMHQTIGPLMISARPHPIDKIVYVKLPAGKVQEKIAALEEKWKEVYPNIGFDYWFVSDEFSRMYVAEERMADLTKGFSLLAILIACLGLFGLASYLAEQRTREIGIRKVLGATIPQILVLLFSSFLKMLGIACLIAIPLAFLLMNNWLQNFVYHVSMEWPLFLFSVLIVLVLTVLTVGYETIRASIANPIDAIRYE